MVKKLLSAGFAFFTENNIDIEDPQLLVWKNKLESVKTRQQLIDLFHVVISGHTYDLQKHSFVASFYLMDGHQTTKLKISSDIVVASPETEKKQKLTSEMRFSGGTPQLAEIFKTYFSDKVTIEALHDNMLKCRLQLNFKNTHTKINLTLNLNLNQHCVRLLSLESNYNDSFLAEVSDLWVDHCHFDGSENRHLTFSFCNEQMTFYTFRLKTQKTIEDLKRFTDYDFFITERYKHLKPAAPFFKAQFQSGLITFLSVSGENLARYVILK